MSTSDINASVVQREERAVQLMINGVKPKDAMKISGCNYSIGGKNYRRIYKRVYRKRKKKEESQKSSKVRRLESQLEQHSKKRESLHQYRQEASNAIAEKHAVEKRLDEMSSALVDSKRR